MKWQNVMFFPSSFAEKERINKVSVTEDKSREKMGYYSTGEKRKRKENGMQDVWATEHVKKSEATARAGKESLSKTAN